MNNEIWMLDRSSRETNNRMRLEHHHWLGRPVWYPEQPPRDLKTGNGVGENLKNSLNDELNAIKKWFVKIWDKYTAFHERTLGMDENKETNDKKG